jgi:hypothetical protein
VEVALDWNDTLKCKGNAANFHFQPACVALGAVQWWFIYFTVGFGVFQAVQVWAIATQVIKRNTSKWLWKISLIVIVVAASALTTILLSFDRITNEYNNPFTYCLVGSRAVMNTRLGAFRFMRWICCRFTVNASTTNNYCTCILG